MIEVNERLKSELFEVVGKMNSQIDKFQEKRKQKAQQIKEVNTQLLGKEQKIKSRAGT